MDRSKGSPRNISSLIEEGVGLVHEGKAKQAKAVLDKVLFHCPSSAKALCCRGSASRILGQFDAAIRDFIAAIRLDPNEMDGLRPDTDIFFILTTNRPQALEAALASRPGRIDQAIEFPLPNDEGRARLVKLYSKGMHVPDKVVATIVKRTECVSASFIKEIMRRAAQFHFERDGNGVVIEADIDAALEELLFAGGSLNCSLLGMQSIDRKQ